MDNIPFLTSRKGRGGVVYYRYRMPDGTFKALGKDELRAKQLAIALNAKREQRELARQAEGRTMAELIEFYEPIKLASTKSDASRTEWKRKFKRYKEWMGSWRVPQVTVQQLDELLAVRAPDYDPYRLHRLLLKELFTIAIGKGWRKESEGNPGNALLPPRLSGRVKGQKLRKRMTEDQFWAIHAQAHEWLRLGMELALHIGIRRGDISRLKNSQFHDGYLFFIPSKTADLTDPAAIKIKMTEVLKDLHTRSQNLAPLSPFYLHRSQAQREGFVDREHRTQVLPEQLSRHFKTARDKAVKANPDLFRGLQEEELPTFHEIRSLCARRYTAQGMDIERVQSLLGHASSEMTAYYNNDPDKIVWQEVSIG